MTSLPLNTGDTWIPEKADMQIWVQLYPIVDVEQELNAMAGWLHANPTRRKTMRGIKRFINSWLSKAQDKGGASPLAKEGGKILKTRDMSSLDDLTHNVSGDLQTRAYFIKKYGQCFENGVRYT